MGVRENKIVLRQGGPGAGPVVFNLRNMHKYMRKTALIEVVNKSVENCGRGFLAVSRLYG